MLAQPKLTSSDRARNYFEQDTYYLNNEFEQGSFYGKLKDELGLDEFNLEDFDKLLMGKEPRTGEDLLRLTKKDFDENGERKRAAADLTFAADKDISILYEISNDEMKDKIRAAFNRSIDKALDYAEENYSYAKDRNDPKGKKADSKMLFTRFDHSESRNDDMHLHVHALAMNMIKDENDNWRTVEYNQIMYNHQLIGQIQRNKFAKELQGMGVELEVSDIKVGTFKTKNVDKEVRDMFSTRSKDIKEEMEKSGQHSYKATHTAQKQTAKWKDKDKDRLQIQEENIQRLKDAGADIEKIKELNGDLDFRQLDVTSCVKIAFDDLTDKKSVFSKEDILKHSLKIALLSEIGIEEIEKEFEKYEDLVIINEKKNQYTTKEILEKEEYIFGLKENKNFSITKNSALVRAEIESFEKSKGFSLKQGQKELVETILNDESQFIIAQGVAGAGKSTSLEIVRKVAEEQGINIVALAPTGTATDNLAKEAGIKQNMTVAKFLKENGAELKDSLVIVDEAGMMGLRDTHDLLKLSEENNLKVVFSGDSNQKKSIAQGDIFAGIQRKGFKTVNLSEGNRQKNEKMRLALSNILDRDIVTGLGHLKDTTFEIKGDDRLNEAMREYLKDRDNSLLITTTNNDRVKLNEMIRSHLVKTGEITNSKSFDLRETINLSDLEKRSALHYKQDQKVFLSKNLGSISAGREAVIKSVDNDNNTITIQHTTKAKKPKIITETVDLTTDGNKLNLFQETVKDLGIGEQIIMRKNDKKLGLSNGQIGKITNVKEDILTVQFDKKTVEFSTNQYKYINHAYAITDFASQGKTTEKVIAVANSQAASFNDFYTQITRAKYEAVIITDDLKELQERAARDSVKLNASELIKNIQKENIKMEKNNEELLEENQRLNEKFEMLEQLSTSKDKMLESLNGIVEKLESQIGNFESLVEEQNKQIKYYENVEELQGKMDLATTELINEQKKEIAALEAQVSQNKRAPERKQLKEELKTNEKNKTNVVNHEYLSNYTVVKDGKETKYTHKQTGVSVVDKGVSITAISGQRLEDKVAALIHVAKSKDWDLEQLDIIGSKEFKKEAQKQVKEELQKTQDQSKEKNQEDQLKKSTNQQPKENDLLDNFETVSEVVGTLQNDGELDRGELLETLNKLDKEDVKEGLEIIEGIDDISTLKEVVKTTAQAAQDVLLEGDVTLKDTISAIRDNVLEKGRGIEMER